MAVHLNVCAVILSCLMVLWKSLHTATGQSCPVTGCTGCGISTVVCHNAGLTSFPQLPVNVQEMVTHL